MSSDDCRLTLQLFLIVAESLWNLKRIDLGGGVGERGEYIYLTCFKTLGSSSKRGMEKVGRREEREKEGEEKEWWRGGEEIKTVSVHTPVL